MIAGWVAFFSVLYVGLGVATGVIADDIFDGSQYHDERVKVVALFWPIALVVGFCSLIVAGCRCVPDFAADVVDGVRSFLPKRKVKLPKAKVHR